MVPNSPNCFAPGPRIAAGYGGLTWWPETFAPAVQQLPGANVWRLDRHTGDAAKDWTPIRCNVVNSVTQLPPAGRLPLLQEYADKGLSQGVKAFEALDPVALDRVFADFYALQKGL